MANYSSSKFGARTGKTVSMDKDDLPMHAHSYGPMVKNKGDKPGKKSGNKRKSSRKSY